MERADEIAESLVAEWQAGRLRLWLTSLRDSPDAFGPWAGLVRLTAEHIAGQWQPPRPQLLERLKNLADSGGESDAPALLLPLAADALEADLAAKGVPKDVARRARELFTLDAPVAQWRF